MEFTEENLKAIPGKAMMGAIKSMNTYLEGKEDSVLIIFEKQSKQVALENLLVPILAAITADEAGELPEDVIAFYNDHLAVDEPTPEKPKKEKAPKKPKEEKAPKKPRAPSNEQSAYDMVKAGKTDAEILAHFTGVYAGKGKDEAFIAKRAGIYTNIGKRKLAAEDPKFAADWAAEKEAAKPPKPVKEKKVKETKTAGAGSEAPAAKTKTKVKTKKPAAGAKTKK